MGENDLMRCPNCGSLYVRSSMRPVRDQRTGRIRYYRCDSCHKKAHNFKRSKK